MTLTLWFLTTYLQEQGKTSPTRAWYLGIQGTQLTQVIGLESGNHTYGLFDGLLEVSTSSLQSSILVLLLMLILGAEAPAPGVSHLLLAALGFGLLTLQLSDDLLVSFVSLEQMNMSIYLLICSYSSGIKYILTSLVLTALFIQGIALVYGTHGSLNIPDLNLPILLVFQLKLGIYPFHQLTADQYEGISTPLMVLLQLPVKLGVFLFLIRWYEEVNSSTITHPIAGLAVQIPAISTQYAYTFKRFMSQSSSSYQTIQFLLLFTYNYSITGYAIVYIVTLGYIMRYHTLLLFLQFLSVAGLPPFIGFFYKLYLLNDQLLLENYWLQAVTLLSSLILTANYLGRSVIIGPSVVPAPVSQVTGILLFWMGW